MDLSNVKVIDQKSVVMKVRAKVVKGTEKRFVMNDHFRYAIRRAANRAGLPLTKRSLYFAPTVTSGATGHAGPTTSSSP